MTTISRYGKTPHWPWSQTVHKDDRYHKTPEFFLNRDVIVEEKLDGGNATLFDGKVYARSTGGEAIQPWFCMAKKHHAWKTLQDTDWMYSGEEIYAKHAIEYGPVLETRTFYLFAVRNDSIYESWDNIVAHASRLDFGLPWFEKRRFSSCKEITEFFAHHQKHPEDLKNRPITGECEGFVIRNPDKFLVSEFHMNVCKYVRERHIQTDSRWEATWKPIKFLTPFGSIQNE